MGLERMFRCFDPNCNTLLSREGHDLGRCDGCQGIKFIIATYLTEDEQKKIDDGEIVPHKVDLDPMEDS